MDDKFIGKLSDDKMMSCSRLAALMGDSGFSSPNDELRKSIAAIDNRPLPGDPPGEAAEWGNHLENTILRVMAERLDLAVDTQITERVEHAALPMQGSLDGILEGDGRTIKHAPELGIYVIGSDEIDLDGQGVAESKATSAPPAEELPPYRGPWQVQGLMACTDMKWAAIGVLYRGAELRIYLMRPDPAMQAKIAADVLDFERRLGTYRTDGVIDFYPPMSSNDAADTYAGDNDLPPVTLTEKTSLKVIELMEAQATRKSMARIIDQLQAQIMDEMGSHTMALAYDEAGEIFAEISWGYSPARSEYSVAARPARRAKTLKIVEAK